MKIAPKPPDEAGRLAALHALHVLETPPEVEFDALVKAASAVCGMPISLVSLVDAERQWFKATHGLEGAIETKRDIAFCAHAILNDELFVVGDAAADARFSNNPLVTGAPNIRFYAGAPVKLSDGHCVGTLCVIDTVPRELTPDQREILLRLSQAVARALEGRRALMQLRDLAAELATKNAVLHATLQSIEDAVFTVELLGRITWANPAAERLLDQVLLKLKGQNLSDVLDVRDFQGNSVVDTILAELWESRSAKFPDEAVLRKPTGAEIEVAGMASPLLGCDGLDGAVIVLRDVSVQRGTLRELAHRATHDPLTGLVNRSELENRIAQLITDSAPGALLFIDLDHFKIVNDRCGHAAGDMVLREVASILMELVASGDTVARLGGDEFAVLLAGCGLPGARNAAHAVCDRLETYRFVQSDRRFRIGASIGVAPVGGALRDVKVVLNAADNCAYAAKHAGRNRVVVWQERDTAVRDDEASRWVDQIERAIDEDRFELFGQHVLPMRPGVGVPKVEVLLRLRGDDGSLLPPGAFMPAAERFNLMGRIDRWVVRKTLAWMAKWSFDGEVQRIGINLSGQSLTDADFRDWFLMTLDEAGAGLCGRLTVEITETVAITQLNEASSFVQRLQQGGVRVALDDFGAGAAGFGYLKNLPVNYLKIDGHFIRHLLTDPFDLAVVKCFIQMARAIDVKTVAEFVESAEVLTRLQELGVDFAQGYFLHRPEPLSQAAAARAYPLVSRQHTPSDTPV